MVELQSLKNELAEAKMKLASMQKEAGLQNTLVNALAHLVSIKERLSEPNESDFEEEMIEPTEPVSSAVVVGSHDFYGFIRNHTAHGQRFGIDEILAKMGVDAQKTDRTALSYALWKMAKDGEIQTVSKGRRGSPASYFRP